MTRLLTTEGVVVLAHAGVDVLVAHRRGLVLEAGGVERPEEAEVGHDRRDDRLLGETTVLAEIGTADVEDQVPVDHAAALVDGEAAVGVSVVGEAHVETLLDHEGAELLDMRGTAVHVDVEAVGGVVDHVGLGTKGVEDGARDARGGTVRTVETDLEALEGEATA